MDILPKSNQSAQSQEKMESDCIRQSRELIDKALEEMDVSWNTLPQLPAKEAAYQRFAKDIAVDKYRDCMSRGITK